MYCVLHDDGGQRSECIFNLYFVYVIIGYNTGNSMLLLSNLLYYRLGGTYVYSRPPSIKCGSLNYF